MLKKIMTYYKVKGPFVVPEFVAVIPAARIMDDSVGEKRIMIEFIFRNIHSKGNDRVLRGGYGFKMGVFAATYIKHPQRLVIEDGVA
jgi:hypothetical protein